VKVSRDQRRTDLSPELERRYFGAVDGVDASAVSGELVEGENETAKTGAEWPISCLEDEGREPVAL